MTTRAEWETFLGRRYRAPQERQTYKAAGITIIRRADTAELVDVMVTVDGERKLLRVKSLQEAWSRYEYAESVLILVY
jgi:hypothetical protein